MRNVLKANVATEALDGGRKIKANTQGETCTEESIYVKEESVVVTNSFLYKQINKRH